MHPSSDSHPVPSYRLTTHSQGSHKLAHQSADRIRLLHTMPVADTLENLQPPSPLLRAQLAQNILTTRERRALIHVARDDQDRASDG